LPSDPDDSSQVGLSEAIRPGVLNWQEQANALVQPYIKRIGDLPPTSDVRMHEDQFSVGAPELMSSL
jgi:hypothetical protein